jgi:hypothetical protein
MKKIKKLPEVKNCPVHGKPMEQVGPRIWICEECCK